MPVNKSIPPQSVRIYRLLLLNNKAMSAREIAGEIDILPHSVYRAVKVLIELGCIESFGSRPIKFRGRPVAEAVSPFLLISREWFLESFSTYETMKNGNFQKDQENLDISFIPSRQELMELSTQDLKRANEEVDLIVSGHEAPPETMLQHMRAIKRGVSIKILTQHSNSQNREMLKNWQQLGIEVKSGSSIRARVYIFDTKIVYITSYNLRQKEEAIGVRFNYPPIALLIKEIFTKHWEGSKEV